MWIMSLSPRRLYWLAGNSQVREKQSFDNLGFLFILGVVVQQLKSVADWDLCRLDGHWLR